MQQTRDPKETPMSETKTLRQRFLDGDEIAQLRLPMSYTREQVQTALREQPCDLLYIDAQHGPVTDWDIVRICSAAEELGVPTQMRIRHLQEVYLIGHYLDLGLFGIKVPEVKCARTVREAIDAFYFPPVGQRSWGGWVGYGIQDRKDRLQYARWWNQNGILGFKIESVQAVLNVRALVQPGITYVDYGPSDLSFSLETEQHPRLQSIEDCRAFVAAELAGSHVRIM
jgi:2-keto-3-deoxy-L-rhamnonate aldolase RhmA